VTDILPAGALTVDEVLALAAAVEKYSEHPLERRFGTRRRRKILQRETLRILTRYRVTGLRVKRIRNNSCWEFQTDV
jgi:cation transport ATPase